MKKLIAVFAVLGLSTIAMADEAPPAAEVTPDPTTEAPEAPEAPDCSTLEGEEKTKCEEAQAAPAPEAGKAGKGGKALTKSEDGRMESFDEDE